MNIKRYKLFRTCLDGGTMLDSDNGIYSKMGGAEYVRYDDIKHLLEPVEGLVDRFPDVMEWLRREAVKRDELPFIGSDRAASRLREFIAALSTQAAELERLREEGMDLVCAWDGRESAKAFTARETMQAAERVEQAEQRFRAALGGKE